MISAQIETFSDFAEELPALAGGHQAEADLLDRTFPRVVVRDAFFAIEKTGKSFCVTLREDGRLIGYSGGILAYDPQRRTPSGGLVKVFSECGVYVVPERRGHGLQMVRRLIAEVKARGAQIIYLRGPTDARASKLFERLGGLPVETTYAILVAENIDAGDLCSSITVPIRSG